jgi:PKD repeat protein
MIGVLCFSTKKLKLPSMKNFVAFCLIFLCCILSHAQICSIDYNQTTSGIYPDTLSPGTVGQTYAADVTFVMPLDTLGHDFTNFHILSLALPVGLSWQCNNANSNCDYNPQVSQHGCVHISGTPLLAGQYCIDVTVLADLSIIQGYPFTFQLFMEVLPNTSSVSNNGFDMIGSSGCAPITVNFTNNNPGFASYLWDFGNGNISFSEQPAPQVYVNPGEYIVQFTAYGNQDTTHVYTLSNVQINSMSNYGNSFPSYDNADTYFKLLENGILVFQSSIIGDQNPPVQWSTSMNLNPSSTYVIEIWEADDGIGEVLFGGDDYMGSHTISLNGCNSCAAGTSNFNYTINHQIIYPQVQVLAQDTVHVYGFPNTPVIAYDSLNHTLSTSNSGNAYQWYFNGSPISGSTNQSHLVIQSGIYQVLAINSSGCATISDTLIAVFCNPLVQPSIQLTSSDELTVTNYPFDSNIQWYHNGIEIPNEENDTLQISSGGGYHVVLTDFFGCLYETVVFPFNVSLSDKEIMSWEYYPNPASNEIHIQIEDYLIGAEVSIVDLNGRLLKKEALNYLDTIIDIQSLSNGSYIIELNKRGIKDQKKMVKF